MKSLISRYLALSIMLAGVPVAAEDLDAALAAQKKKAERRVYSDSALIEDHNLEVPRTQSDEEKALDKKLREMEAQAERQASSPEMTAMPREVSTVPRPVENRNWLTPAALDDSAAVAMTNQVEDAWLTRELERQKELKTLEAAKKEASAAEKLLREKTRIDTGLPEQGRLKQYQLAPSGLLDTGKKANAPAYITPQSGIPDPLAAIRPSSKQETPSTSPLFSPEAARISSQLDKDPLQSTRSSRLEPNLGKPSSGISSGLNQPEGPASLTPLQMIKKSSPINRPDPFADDHEPAFKSSIWN